MKIRPAEPEKFYEGKQIADILTDGQAGMTKSTVTFRNFAKKSEKLITAYGPFSQTRSTINHKQIIVS